MMLAVSLFLVLAILLCLGLSFFFSGSEVAIISANKFRLRGLHDEGDIKATKLLEMLDNTRRMLIMVLIGTNLANVLTALFFKNLIVHIDPAFANTRALGQIHWSELLSLLILTPIVIIFAEILPKAIFRAHADGLVAVLRPAFLVWLWIFKPVIWLIERVTSVLLGPLADQHQRDVRQLSRQDVINLIAPEDRERREETEQHEDIEPVEMLQAEAIAPEDVQAAAIAQARKRDEERAKAESDERRMAQNIIELHETLADEIMTPLAELVAVQLGRMDVEGFKALARVTGFSRFPVYRDRIVNLTGTIDLYRVLREGNGERRLEDFVERPHYVPSTKRVDSLLQEFLKLRIKNAIVVDEYGGCAGWISREDMLEEIVGELEDELDRPVQTIEPVNDGAYLIDGRTEIHLINDELDTDFDDENWETLAGLILNEIGRIPAVGDRIGLGPWTAEIVRMEGNRIDKVRMSRTEE